MKIKMSELSQTFLKSKTLSLAFVGRPQSGPDPRGGPVLRHAAGEGRLHRLRAQELRGGLPGITRFPAKT